MLALVIVASRCLEVEVPDDAQPAEIAAIADPAYAWQHEATFGTHRDGYDVVVYAQRDAVLTSNPEKEETDMSTPVIQNLTTFRGQDIASMSERTLLANIKQCNEDMEALKGYGISSRKINARIQELASARALLVKALDGPDEAIAASTEG